MNDLERIRTGAVGLKVEPELLTLFSAGREEEMQIPTREGETHVFVYYPKEGQEQYPLFINLHGGGFVKGHREQDLVFCRNICQNAGCMVVDIDYKTAPEKMYPYALFECYDVTKYLWDHAEEWKLDRKRFVMGGHSAGGNLTLGTAILSGHQKEFELSGIICDYPAVDLDTDPAKKRFGNDPTIRPPIADARMYNDWYIAPERRRESTASPVYAADEELAALPPVLMITAGHDMLGEEAEKLVYRMLEVGTTVIAKRVMGADHGFIVRRKPGFEQGEELIFAFLKNRFEK